jgi:predicted phage terminase large subunit-like protein
MDKLYAAYLNQLKDRKLDGAKEVHIGTRWVPNDVTGRIIDENEGNPRCKVIAIPALNEQGESNFNYLFGLGFSTEYYEEMRKSLEEAGEGDSWSAKYMCEPYYIGGLTFPEDELNYYDDLPNGEPDAIIAVCDTKDRGKDYCVQPIGYVYGNKHYIEDVICDNSLPEVVEPRLASSLVLHNVALARYESNSAGGRIADGIAEQCKKLGHTVTIQKQYSTQNKETRIIVDAGWIKQNCYFKKDPPNADYKKFINMLTHYTTEGKNLHDDAPDAMSMYKRFADTIVSPEVEVIDRLW